MEDALEANGEALGAHSQTPPVRKWRPSSALMIPAQRGLLNTPEMRSPTMSNIEKRSRAWKEARREVGKR
jgi:hypothetical protein